MSLASLAVQLLNGLASASSLFLIAAGLTLIFGVTRVVNFAHGSLFMLGAYIAFSAGTALGAYDDAALGFADDQRSIPLAALKPGRFNPRRHFAEAQLEP